MSLTPLFKLIVKRKLLPAIRVNRLYKPYYKLSFLAGLKNCGLLDELSKGPMTFGEIANAYCHDEKACEALNAWLHLGMRLKLLRVKNNRYHLKGLALTMSLPQNDATLGLAQEAATLHHKLVMDTPIKLQNKTLWQLDDQDDELTTRSSRVLEEFQVAAIDKFFPKSGGVRLLEVGCGSACYIRHSATRNSSLQALGLELQDGAAEIARSNVREWGLQDQVTIEVGDIRDRVPESEFDIVTLYNNIYYFPVEARVSFLAHLRKLIKPDGFILLTTCCQGGNLGMEVLNLWGAATDTGGRLPNVTEMRKQFEEAGYANTDAVQLIPGEQFFAFRASVTPKP